MNGPFLGIYTTIYPVPDLPAAKHWYAEAFGATPYFDEPFYVGFEIGGYELGLIPAAGEAQPGPGGGQAHWGVANADEAYAHLLSLGATPRDQVRDVGGGIRVASVDDPWGNLIGIVENPGFRVPKLQG